MNAAASTSSSHKILVFDEPRELPKAELDEFKAKWKAKGVEFTHHSWPTQAPFLSEQEAFKIVESIDEEHGPITGCISLGAFLHRYKPIGDEFCQCLPQLGFVTGGGAGYDNINDKALSRNGVYYCNTPESVSYPTADSASTLILATLKDFITYDRSARRGNWSNGVPFGINPKGATLGILGMGSIGRIVCRQMKAFGMKVVYHNRNRLPEDLEEGARFVSSLPEFLGMCDIVSVHIPLSPATRHFLSHDEFKMFKHGCRLVNTARGPVVDEEALVQAMKDGKIAAVGLDVFEEEPKIHPYLVESDRAFLTPHTGSHTMGTLAEVVREMLKNLDSYLSIKPGEAPHNAVNKLTDASQEPSRLNIILRLRSPAPAQL